MTLQSGSIPSRPSAYPAKSSSNNRYGSKSHPLTSTRSFIELDDRTGSQDTLEESRGKGDRIIETPIQDKLNPEKRDMYGNRAVVEIGSGKQESRGMGNAIMMTTTLDQSERRL